MLARNCLIVIIRLDSGFESFMFGAFYFLLLPRSRVFRGRFGSNFRSTKEFSRLRIALFECPAGNLQPRGGQNSFTVKLLTALGDRQVRDVRGAMLGEGRETKLFRNLKSC